MPSSATSPRRLLNLSSSRRTQHRRPSASFRPSPQPLSLYSKETRVNPSSWKSKNVKKKKERAKELEGIDLSNIGSRSRRRSTNFFTVPPPPLKAKIPDVSGDEEEESEEENSDSGESSEEFNEDAGDESDEVYSTPKPKAKNCFPVA